MVVTIAAVIIGNTVMRQGDVIFVNEQARKTLLFSRAAKDAD